MIRLYGKGCVICMYKIGVIGDYDSICGFAALGLDIFAQTDAEGARAQLKTLAESGYGIIYITEQYIEKMRDEMEKYRGELLPAIIPIPSVGTSSGFGRACVKKYVEQAVGSDIIFNDD